MFFFVLHLSMHGTLEWSKIQNQKKYSTSLCKWTAFMDLFKLKVKLVDKICCVSLMFFFFFCLDPKYQID